MSDDTPRIVQVLQQPNPAVMRVKPDPDAAQIMGQFRPARYDKVHHAYDMPVDLAGAFETFCRMHGLLLLDTRPATMPTGSHLTDETLRVLRESQERLADPEHQAEVNERGLRLVKLALRLAAIKRAHQGPR